MASSICLHGPDAAHPAPGRPPVPGWPLVTSLGPIGALPTAPRLARVFSVLALNGWALSDWADVAELVVSELTTNVVQAATGPDGRPCYDARGRLPELWVRLLSDRIKLRIEVWDSIPPVLGAPAVRHAESGDESGRGLEIVEAVTDSWGWDDMPGWDGKRVWALLPRPAHQATV